MRFPVDHFETDFNITAGNSFGQKITDTYYHSGIDLNNNGGGNSDLGTPLKAIADWECTSVHEHSTGYGKHLHYKFTVDNKVYYAHYAHCQDIFIKVGDKGKEGATIATIGSTGNSTYSHLHLEIKNQSTGVDGIAKTKEDLQKWENPIDFIEKWSSIDLPNIDMNSQTKIPGNLLSSIDHPVNEEFVEIQALNGFLAEFGRLKESYVGALRNLEVKEEQLKNCKEELQDYKNANNIQADQLEQLHKDIKDLTEKLEKLQSTSEMPPKPPEAPENTGNGTQPPNLPNPQNSLIILINQFIEIVKRFFKLD